VIALLEGTVAEKAGDRAVLLAGGVGYEVLVSASTMGRLPPVGNAARVLTRLHVREDALVLFGFATADERSLFDMLVSVTGVGPKLALSFLSVLRPDALRRAVAAGDLAALSSVPGVGKKMASRVAMELKDRLGIEDGEVDGPLSEVREALLALGLSPQEAREAMTALGGDGELPVEELLRLALQSVGR
jgi:Holliday junction DNA helicase RuvA